MSSCAALQYDLASAREEPTEEQLPVAVSAGAADVAADEGEDQQAEGMVVEPETPETGKGGSGVTASSEAVVTAATVKTRQYAALNATQNSNYNTSKSPYTKS